MEFRPTQKTYLDESGARHYDNYDKILDLSKTKDEIITIKDSILISIELPETCE